MYKQIHYCSWEKINESVWITYYKCVSHFQALYCACNQFQVINNLDIIDIKCQGRNVEKLKINDLIFPSIMNVIYLN